MRRLFSAALLLTLLCTGDVTVTFANDAAATDGDTIAFFLPEGESVQFKRQ